MGFQRIIRSPSAEQLLEAYLGTLVDERGGQHERHAALRASLARCTALAPRQPVVSCERTPQRATDGRLLCELLHLELACGHHTSGVLRPGEEPQEVRLCVHCHREREAQRSAMAEQPDLFAA